MAKGTMKLGSNGTPGQPNPPERRHDGASSIEISRKWAFTGTVPMGKSELQQTKV